MITSSKENQYKQQHDKSEDSSSYSYSSQDAKDSWKKTWKQAERKYQQQNSYSENQGNQKSCELPTDDYVGCGFCEAVKRLDGRSLAHDPL